MTAVLVKWIRCSVVDRERFDRGQRTWTAVAGRPGFLGQGGGWSTRRIGTAHVFGCWTGRTAYDAFMADAHDEFALDQVGSYADIDVRLFEHRLDIGGRFAPTFAGAAVLRLAHCHVHADRVAHFVAAQREVWNPGMGTASGFLRGGFGRRGENEFLVLSMWRSDADHAGYREDQFPELRRRSDASRDLATIEGDLIQVEPAWSVEPD